MAVGSVTVTDSALVKSGRCRVHDILIGGTDGVNNATVTVYDGLTAAGNEILPEQEYDATALCLNGVAWSNARVAEIGVYVEITTSGTCKVTLGIEG
jgi:hypothetical protein